MGEGESDNGNFTVATGKKEEEKEGEERRDGKWGRGNERKNVVIIKKLNSGKGGKRIIFEITGPTKGKIYLFSSVQEGLEIRNPRQKKFLELEVILGKGEIKVLSIFK